MKIIVVLLVIGLVGGLAMYLLDVKNFDPNKAGEAAYAAVAPGMTWKQVIADNAAGPPKTYRPMMREVRSGVETIKPGAENPFTEEALAARVDNGRLEHGFCFRYVFSNAVEFQVDFDEAGTVVGKHRLMTTKDLLQW